MQGIHTNVDTREIFFKFTVAYDIVHAVSEITEHIHVWKRDYICDTTNNQFVHTNFRHKVDIDSFFAV